MMASIQEVVPMLNDFLAVASFALFLLDKFLTVGVSPRLLEVFGHIYFEQLYLLKLNLIDEL